MEYVVKSLNMEMELKQIPKPHKTTNPKHREDYVFVEKPGEDFTGT